MMQRLLLLLSIYLFSCGQTITSNSDSLKENQLDSDTHRYNLSDTTIKVIWREDKYDTALQFAVSNLILNENYFKTISEPEKAAIAYVATYVGSECDWDGEANDSQSNLNCKVIKALDLGYQCSDKHLNFLRHWFKSDTSFINKLTDCPIVPFTATHQNTFDHLTIKTNADSILLSYEASWTNGPGRDSGDWTESILFKIDNNELKVLSKKTKHSS
jgi:hypothetical protein